MDRIGPNFIFGICMHANEMLDEAQSDKKGGKGEVRERGTVTVLQYGLMKRVVDTDSFDVMYEYEDSMLKNVSLVLCDR